LTSPRPPELFVDGQSTVLLTGGTIRIDLYALETNRRSLRDNQIQTILVRLVLSPTGFLQTVAAIGRFLAQNGIKPPLADASSGAAARSPNFHGG
jgi:hypothetical protein